MDSFFRSLPEEARLPVQRALNTALHMPGVTRVMIYGSYAKGGARKDSDLDVAVFFDDESANLRENYKRLAAICSTPCIDIQAQAFFASELEDPCGIVEEIVEYGMEYEET
ncbi:MAG: nucleotidyltransferase domain-containing protein [Oscillospiraceae bacterium]